MPYRVRTPDGELDFPHLADIAQAYSAGLVDPDDEVQEVGSTLWRKARTLPALANAHVNSSVRKTDTSYYRDVLIVVMLGVISLYLSFFREGRVAKGIGFMVAFLLAFQMRRLITKAWKKPY